MSSMPEPLHPVARGLAAPAGALASYPPVERWDDWETYDAAAWPKKVKRRFALDPDDLLQLRGGVRAPRVRRQGDGAHREVRGQPGPSRQPRAELRQGAGDAQPDQRSRAHPLPAAAEGQARRRRVGARDVGRGARRHRRAHPRRAGRGAAEGGHVPRRAAGPRARLSAARAPGLGHRRAQQPHERVLGGRAGRLRVLDGARPAVARPRERAVHAAPVLPPRDRALLQPARAADHRGQDAGREDLRDRHAPVEHGVDGRLVALAVAGHGSGAAARDRAHPRARAHATTATSCGGG